MSSGKGEGDLDHECTRNTLHRTHFDHALSTSHSDMPPDVEPTNLSLDLFGTNSYSVRWEAKRNSNDRQTAQQSANQELKPQDPAREHEPDDISNQVNNLRRSSYLFSCVRSMF